MQRTEGIQARIHNRAENGTELRKGVYLYTWDLGDLADLAIRGMENMAHEQAKSLKERLERTRKQLADLEKKKGAGKKGNDKKE